MELSSTATIFPFLNKDENVQWRKRRKIHVNLTKYIIMKNIILFKDKKQV